MLIYINGVLFDLKIYFYNYVDSIQNNFLTKLELLKLMCIVVVYVESVLKT